MTRAFFCTHVLVCVFWVLPPTTNAQDSYDPRVCFYEHGNYAGTELCARESAQSMPAGWNDFVSSFKLFDGARVVAYENVTYDRYMGTYVSSTPNLSKNDVISSFKMIMPRERPRVCLYTGYRYTGTEYCYTQSPLVLFGAINNTTSSIRLHGEISVEVADASNNYGETTYIVHDIPHLDPSGRGDNDWDDQPSIDNLISWVGIHHYWETPLACFWTDKHYRGTRTCTTSNIADLREMHDRIHSFRVYGHTVVSLYEHSNYAGDRTRAMHDAYNMDFLRNEISSVTVSVRKTQDFACLYEFNTYRGTPVCAEAEGGSNSSNGWSDATLVRPSSMMTVGNVVVDFFPEKNFAGQSMSVYHSNDRFAEFTRPINDSFSYTRDWDNQVESFRVLPNRKFGTGTVGASDNYIRETELLEFNERLARSVPFSSIMQTHNSAIATNYGYNAQTVDGGLLGANQKHSLAAQLDMGVRFLEVDVYYHHEGGGAIGRGIRVCHVVDCGEQSQRQAFERMLTEVHNWLRGADEDDVIAILLENGFPQGSSISVVETIPIIGAVKANVDSDAIYKAARSVINTTLPNLVYTVQDAYDQGVLSLSGVGVGSVASTFTGIPRGCKHLPKNLTRQHIRAAGKRVLFILMHKTDNTKNCGYAGQGNNAFDGLVFTVKPYSNFSAYSDCNNTSVSVLTPRVDSNDRYYERVNESDHAIHNRRYTLAEEDSYMRCGGTGMSHDHMNWDDIRPVALSDWYGETQAGAIGPLLYGFLDYDDLPKPTAGAGCVSRKSTTDGSATSNPSHDEMIFELESCTTLLPYACQDEAPDSWFITVSAGPWSYGSVACSGEVPTTNFAVPWSKYQMVTLANATVEAAARPACSSSAGNCPANNQAWVNLRASNGQWLPLANIAGTFPTTGTLSSQFVIPNPAAPFDFDESNAKDNDTDVFSSIAVTAREENAFYELDLKGVYFIESIELWAVSAGWLLDVNNGGLSVFVSDIPIPELSRDAAGTGWQNVPTSVTEYSFPEDEPSSGIKVDGCGSQWQVCAGSIARKQTIWDLRSLKFMDIRINDRMNVVSPKR